MPEVSRMMRGDLQIGSKFLSFVGLVNTGIGKFTKIFSRNCLSALYTLILASLRLVGSFHPGIPSAEASKLPVSSSVVNIAYDDSNAKKSFIEF